MGTGSPEGAVTAYIGSLWLASDGTTGTTLWVKEAGTGNTGWVAVAAGTGGGAPTTADYLVGTANGGLSAEIVVGTSPGGELGGTWASPTIDDGIDVQGWTMGGTLRRYSAVGNSGESQTITFSDYDKFSLTLNAATVTIDLNEFPASGVDRGLLVILTQDGTGGRAVTWSDSAAMDKAPTLNTAAGATTAILFSTLNGGTNITVTDDTVADLAYNESTWNGSNLPTTRNAVRDEIENMRDGTTWTGAHDFTGATPTVPTASASSPSTATWP
jgi:hypothetical protein